MKKQLQGNEISVIIGEVGVEEWKNMEWKTGKEVTLGGDEKDQKD